MKHLRILILAIYLILFNLTQFVGTGAVFTSHSILSGNSVTTGHWITPAVTVEFPEGGEVFSVGESITILWTATPGHPSSTIDRIDIYLSEDSGADNYPHIIAENISNTGEYGWNIPDIKKDTLRIKVVATDNHGLIGEGTTPDFDPIEEIDEVEEKEEESEDKDESDKNLTEDEEKEEEKEIEENTKQSSTETIENEIDLESNSETNLSTKETESEIEENTEVNNETDENEEIVETAESTEESNEEIKEEKESDVSENQQENIELEEEIIEEESENEDTEEAKLEDDDIETDIEMEEDE